MEEAQTVEQPEQLWRPVEDESVVEAIAFTVAEVEGIPPTQLHPPLNDVIDPDVLDRLFVPAFGGHGDSAGRVVFPYRGHMVTYSADGFVTVDPGAAP